MSIDFTKPLQLSDGTPLRLLCTDAPPPYPIVCLCEDTKLFVLFTSDGKRPPGSGSIYLMNVPEKMNVPEQVTVDVWVNVYDGYIAQWSTKSGALEGRNTNCRATLHIKRTVPLGHVDE